MQAKEPVLGQLKDKMQGMANRLKGATANASARVRRGAQHATASTRNALAGNAGYSMAEVLATVAIILILCGIVAMNVVSFQANLRQKELDAKAEVIYTAAQDQFTRIMASGRAPLFAYDATTTSATGVKLIPSTDAIPGDVDPDNLTVEKNQICYITSDQLNLDDGTNTAADYLFDSGGLDDELLNCHWVIEYDYKTLTVYSVYYSEDDSDNCNCASGYTGSFDTYNNLYRRYAYRLDALKNGEAYVGYHSGGAGSLSSLLLEPDIKVYNTEKLEAVITCLKPLGTGNVTFKVTISEANNSSNKYVAYYAPINSTKADAAQGDVYYYKLDGTFQSLTARTSRAADETLELTAAEKIGNAATLTNQGRLYTLTIDLDSLESDASRFINLYGKGGNNTLTEGADLKISVECLSDTALVEPKGLTYSFSFNSLYASVSGSEALVKYGRHLQNLDESSGVGSAVTSAKLQGNIDFESTDTGAEPHDGWLSTYSSAYFNGTSSGEPCFKPIVNSSLRALNGRLDTASSTGTTSASAKIMHLNAKSDGSAGLFGEVSSDLTVSNLALTGTTVQGTNAGGFAGEVTGGTLNISNCQLYLIAATDLLGSAKSNENVWIKATNAGGLVGRVAGGSVSIDNSFASTVAGNVSSTGAADASKGSAGGLVGSVSSGSVAISKSYADSYLIGASAGGLVGTAAEGASVSVTSSFSAGFLTATTSAAGMVDGKANSIHGSYTLCTTLNTAANGNPESAETTSPVGDYYYIAQGVRELGSAVYYLAINPSAADSSSIEGAHQFYDVTDKTDTSKVATSASALCTALNDDRGSFVVGGSSTPYNLMNQGLTTYGWPLIKTDTSAIPHYGDWTAGFQEGTLVYYEKYEFYNKNGVLQSDKTCYGFKGANVTTTLKDEAELNSERVVVVGDGYALVYAHDALPDGAEVTVTVTDPNVSTATFALTETITKSSTRYVVNNAYDLYPLSVNTSNTDHVNVDDYFLHVTTEDKRNNSSVSARQYWFNPHFADTVKEIANTNEEDNTTPPAFNLDEDQILLRTARQLNNLSLHYEQYRDVTTGMTFYQQRNIAFSEYNWTTFTKHTQSVTEQEPIGNKIGDNNFSFVATYDGGYHEITDVSFATSRYDYVGFFGYVGSGGKVVNTIMCTDYKPSGNHYTVKRKGKISANTKLYMGVLVGYNKGKVDNCAAAGYYLSGTNGTILAYQNTDVYLGGLVGANSGTITNSSADSPVLRLSLTDAKAWAGGFVGRNLVGGSITNCYALGTIEVVDSDGSEGSISGFAGVNAGYLTDSYCATSISAAGDGVNSYGFAPKGGSVSGCTYLNNGTYSYIGKMYPFNFDTTTTSGSPVSYDDMKVASTASNAVSKADSHVHSQTVTSSSRYPYRGVVTYRDDQGTHYVHYGNWQDDVTLGGMGIFYWEKEEGGSNDGYHMTYLGGYEDVVYDYDENGDPIEGTGRSVFRVVGDSSLCRSHDDGGVVTEYGYGFYAEQDQIGKVAAQWSGAIDCSSDNNKNQNETAVALNTITASNYNQKASDTLKAQMENSDTAGIAENGTSIRQYAFFAFTTTPDTNREHISMKKGNITDQNGTLTLTYTETKEGENKSQDTYTTSMTFNVSPFFANAMNVSTITNEVSRNGGTFQARTDLTLNYDKAVITDLDGSSVDYSITIGTENNPYETRSLQQLQYINWNGANANTSTLVSKSNCEQFNYLLYAKTFNVQSVSKIGDIVSTVPENDIRKRADLYWSQTHDIEEAQENHYFTPIAGTTESSDQYQSDKGSQYKGYCASMCAWFGSHYTGQSYTIKNINIKSNSFNVGLFGTVVGAHLSTIVMYADGTSSWTPTIERNTVGYESQVGAYAIGGLVGVAYDYNLDNPTGSITNCAVSGYKILDSSTDVLGLGEANAGGLVGVANIGLSNCEAVCDIELNPRYSGVAQYGIYIRVGGIAGSTRSILADCYSGGSCTLGNNTLDTRTPIAYGDSTKKYEIYIGGIAGSGFTSNYTNFSGRANTTDDGQPKATNCYTYFTFPKDNFSSLSNDRNLYMYTITSMADRQGAAPSGYKAQITNCFYLDSIKTTGVNEIYPLNNGNRTSGKPAGISFDDMSKSDFVNTLNGNRTDPCWDKVTVEDAAGGKIPGKYSFPSAPALDGKDYPFPTVITQKDLTFSTPTFSFYVNVHYGDWPIVGTHWENGRDSMDIFTDMNMDDSAGDAGWAYKSFTIYLDYEHDSDALGKLNLNNTDSLMSYFTFNDGEGSSSTEGDDTSYTSTSSSYVEIASATYDAAKKTVTVVIKAKAKGSANIRFGGIETATFNLQVTDNWTIYAKAGAKTSFDAETNTVRLALNSEAKLELHAKATEGGKDFTSANFGTESQILWERVDPEPSHEQAFDELAVNAKVTPPMLSFKRAMEGTYTIMVTAVYNYHGQELEQQMFITVEMPTKVGLSNNLTNRGDFGDFSDDVTFNEAELGGTTTASTYVTYGGSDNPAPAPSYTENNFFLYATAGDDYLENASNVESVTITDSLGKETTVVPGVFKDDADYYVTLSGATTADNKFAYLGGTLCYTLDTAPSGTLSLDITLTGGYKLSTTVPAAWLTSMKAHRLKLCYANDSNPKKTFAITTDKRVSSLAGLGYSASDFAKTDWELEGWYTSTNENTAVKVLDAQGAICIDYLSGYTSGGFFNLSEDKILYARWTQKTVWVPASTIVSGKRYLIASSEGSSSSDVQAYLASHNGSTTKVPSYSDPMKNSGVLLNQRSVTIKAGSIRVNGRYYDTYIEDGNYAGAVWTASAGSGSEWGVLTNATSGYILAENDYYRDGWWVVLAVDSADGLIHDNVKRKDMKISNGHLYCNQGGWVHPAGDCTLGCSGNSSTTTTLFEETTFDQYTFDYS